MPCEACNTQFTVFKRKKPCMECRRMYCGNCLTKRKEKICCKRCAIFLGRPLSKVELLKLRAKDLIFYLQSKHISTTGCVEKEELVNLVLMHVGTAGVHSPDSDASTFSARDEENRSNTFDHLKNACQNFFTTFSDKIAADLNFDLRPSPSSGPAQPSVFEKPPQRRASRPGDPPFDPSNAQNHNGIPRPNHFDLNQTAGSPDAQSQTDSVPKQSRARGADNQPSANARPRHIANERISRNKRLDDGSGCECSDDEIFTKFRQEYSNKSNDTSSANFRSATTTLHASSSASSSDKTVRSSDVHINEDGTAIGSSDISSFEDLAVAGCSSASTEIEGSWQIIDKPSMNPSEEASTSAQNMPEESGDGILHGNDPKSVLAVDEQLQKAEIFRCAGRQISRRRSDGIVYMASLSNTARSLYNEESADDVADNENSNTSDEMARKRPKKPCRRCGRTKGDIRKYVARLREKLETKTDSSETEIREQIEAFLSFLECENRNPIESKNGLPASVGSSTHPEEPRVTITVPDAAADGAYDAFDIDENDGILVYGTNDSNADQSSPRQFFNLDRIGSKEELEELTVKQLKEVLMLNRIDFKGCCEKCELLERVQRLWDDLQECPSVDKLQPKDLCKICMDAAIECVLLECGHMATCTNCGKVLNECPICRQYIVRVVRFFKA